MEQEQGAVLATEGPPPRTAAPAATRGVPPLAGRHSLPARELHPPPDSKAPPTSLRSLDETLVLLPSPGWAAAPSFGGMPGVATAAAHSQKTLQTRLYGFQTTPLPLRHAASPPSPRPPGTLPKTPAARRAVGPHPTHSIATSTAFSETAAAGGRHRAGLQTPPHSDSGPVLCRSAGSAVGMQWQAG